MMSRVLYRQELSAWALLAVMMGGVEGAVVGMIVKNAYAGVVEPTLLHQSVAIATGAPAFANVMSLFWASLSHGRNKIRFLFTLQIATAAAMLIAAAAPINAVGLGMLIVATVASRLCWSGIVTVRSTVWRANYPRKLRAHMAGRVATAISFVMSITGILIGLAMNHFDQAFRGLYLLAVAFGLAGALTYRHLRVRHHRELLRAEREVENEGSHFNLTAVWRLLRQDHGFRRYMLCMLVFGSGNMMMMAPLLIVLHDHLGFSRLAQVMVTSSVPLLVIPLAVPQWARFLDRTHVVPYRARQSWAFVVANLAFASGAVSGLTPLLWLGAACQGVALAGGLLGWNLGHHDFAPSGQASQYMGVHVTLTGLRGLVMPVLGVSLYEAVEAFAPGQGPWMLYAPLVLSLSGALGFVWLAGTRPATQEA